MRPMKEVLLWGDVAAFLLFTGLALVRAPRTPAWWIGLALATPTFPLWITARLQLGRAFSFRARARQLVTHGLYSRFRHPMYLFGDIAYFGSLLALQYWPLFVLWLCLTPIQLLRIRREDQALETAFGDEYRRYRSGTWF